ncbi:MAG: Stk1 family PASTA domain-containing Ser/Thr kinase [Oscillospiraceae bacterium]|nr:Stk1 family PASTA domain-containing Ser/Thr kinase [Oscillospiraceae bacterium]
MKEDRNDKNIGKKLDGRYELLERIGEGGMADVYRATDVVDNKTVAVKILKKEFAENEEFLRRFRNESKAIAVLSHPNIVKIFDVGFSDRIQFIVMEYIDGFTLNEYMDQEGQLDWRDAVHYILQILRALQHAHSKGIVHRDIKPQNIMMLPDGTIKVMDFGIAKFAREDGKTGTDKAIGTVHYISPEQARGGVTDAKSDLYSVGVMFYEMLTGKKPFDTDNPVSIAVMHMQAEVPLPHTVRPDIQTGLEEIILRAMQKDPKNRYQSAREMMDDIESFKEDPDGCVFGYFPQLLGTKRAAAGDEKTRFFTPVDQPQESGAPDEVRQNPYYDDDDAEEDDEDEDYEEEEKPSFFVPLLSAVIIVVIIVASVMFVLFMTNVLKKTRSPDSAKENRMPGLIGMDYDEAVQQYGKQLNIKVDTTEYSQQEKGKIFKQSVPEGDPVAKGDTIYVNVSLGNRKVTVPNVIEWDVVLAEQELSARGLNVTRRQAYDEKVPNGKVISTDPAPGTEVQSDKDYVVLVVSRGENKQTVEVPSFVGKTVEEAAKIAELAGLQLNRDEVNSDLPQGQIISQNTDPGEQVNEGTVIRIQISNGIPKETTVRISFRIPAEANGTFFITIYQDGIEKFVGQPFNVDYAMGTTTVNVTGTGTAEFLAILTNQSNGKREKIGKYKVDFKSGIVSEAYPDIEGAFRSVDGLIETTPSYTALTDGDQTTTSSSRTWWSPHSETASSSTTVSTTAKADDE